MNPEDHTLPGRRVKVTGDLFHGRVPAGAIYVGRQMPGLRRSPLANPHTLGTTCPLCKEQHDQVDAVLAYAEHLDQRPDLVAAIRKLPATSVFCCWCPLDRPCHADVIRAVLAGESPRIVATGIRLYCQLMTVQTALDLRLPPAVTLPSRPQLI